MKNTILLSSCPNCDQFNPDYIISLLNKNKFFEMNNIISAFYHENFLHHLSFPENQEVISKNFLKIKTIFASLKEDHIKESLSSFNKNNETFFHSLLYNKIYTNEQKIEIFDNIFNNITNIDTFIDLLLLKDSDKNIDEIIAHSFLDINEDLILKYLTHFLNENKNFSKEQIEKFNILLNSIDTEDNNVFFENLCDVKSSKKKYSLKDLKEYINNSIHIKKISSISKTI